jgi:transaldolase
MTENAALKALADNGVSVWLDDLSRDRIETGNLQELIDTKGVVGVTTNPSIFQAALAKGDRYDADLRKHAAAGDTVDQAVFGLTTDDVRNAADILRPVFDATHGKDGRVSIEVDPRLAHETAKTVEQAKELWSTVDRPNVLIKIPATVEGLPAISQVLAEGISVNVTLIFSLDRYRGVMNAFLTGLEQAREAGKDLSQIHSVASFFVSRVDTEIDKRLDAIGTDEAKALKGQAGVANARLAYQAYEEVFSTPRWQNLADDGANAQRPLWASTGVKNPEYSDTLYVTELVAPNTVNTMPEKTLEAVIDHGDIRGDAVTGAYAQAGELLDHLESLGISYTDVTDVLEKEGVEKFEVSWQELLDEAQHDLDLARADVDAEGKADDDRDQDVRTTAQGGSEGDK